MRYFLMVIILIVAFSIKAQDLSIKPETSKKISLGASTGFAVSYTDKTFLLNIPASLSIDYNISEKYFLQFAPKYTWLIKWNEHYLTLPLHFGIRANEKLSFFAGPALTYDIGFFKNWGISAGANYHIGKRSAINVSFFTFTLNDYHIDYQHLPIGLTYSFRIL